MKVGERIEIIGKVEYQGDDYYHYEFALARKLYARGEGSHAVMLAALTQAIRSALCEVG